MDLKYFLDSVLTLTSTLSSNTLMSISSLFTPGSSTVMAICLSVSLISVRGSLLVSTVGFSPCLPKGLIRVFPKSSKIGNPSGPALMEKPKTNGFFPL